HRHAEAFRDEVAEPGRVQHARLAHYAVRGEAGDLGRERGHLISRFETTMSTASGVCLTTLSTTPPTILALTSIRSILLMPGLRGRPAVMMAIPAPAIAS